MAATESQIFFRLSWRALIKRVHVYLQSRFQWHISIHGQDIITFVYWKQMAPIWIKFYFHCRYWHFHHLWFCTGLNWTIGDGVMTSCQFSKMAATARRPKSTSCFGFGDVAHLNRSTTIGLRACQILMIYLISSESDHLRSCSGVTTSWLF